jgi:Ion channel
MKLVLYDVYEGSVPNIQKYIDSVFFVISSMTGLGFAYIYPRTDLEYGMQSLIMLLGVSLYANFFAFFAVTIYNRNK